MKRFIAIIAASLSLLLGSGCGTLLTKTYTAAQENPVTVQSSLASWDAYIKTNSTKVTIATNNKIRDAFNVWKQAQLNVIDMAVAYQHSMATTNTNTVTVEAIFLGSITAADAARTNLITLIQRSSK